MLIFMKGKKKIKYCKPLSLIEKRLKGKVPRPKCLLCLKMNRNKCFQCKIKKHTSAHKTKNMRKPL